MVSGLLVPLLLYRLAVKWNMRWIFTLEKETENKKKAPVDKGSGPVTPAYEIKN
jgi:hypothetical protein